MQLGTWNVGNAVSKIKIRVNMASEGLDAIFISP